MERDYLLKILDREGNFRIILAATTMLVDEAQRRHQCSATAAAALGRVLTATVMMGCDLKNPTDAITIKINGNGSAGTILATADSQGQVRGFISNNLADAPSIRPGKLDVGTVVGTQGYLEVRKDIALKQPFAGKVELVSGEIAEDLASYFLRSEQIPALVALGVLVDTDLSIKASGGLIVQALPEADLSKVELLEKNIADLGPISSAIDNNIDLSAVAARITTGLDCDIVGEMPLYFKCKCSPTKILNVLSSLEAQEFNNLPDNEPIEIICNYCAEPYYYTKTEIKKAKEIALGQ